MSNIKAHGLNRESEPQANKTIDELRAKLEQLSEDMLKWRDSDDDACAMHFKNAGDHLLEQIAIAEEGV